MISVRVCALRQPASFWGVLFLFLCGCLNGEGSDREDTESFDSWQVGVNDCLGLDFVLAGILWVIGWRKVGTGFTCTFLHFCIT